MTKLEPVPGSYKLVEFSYPSSPNAVEFGFAKTGCYTLHTANMGFVPLDGHKTVGGYATAKQAVQAGMTGRAALYPWHAEMNSGWRAEALKD